MYGFNQSETIQERSEKKNWGHFSMTQHGKKKLFFFSDGRKKSSAEEKDSFFFRRKKKIFLWKQPFLVCAVAAWDGNYFSPKFSDGRKKSSAEKNLNDFFPAEKFPLRHPPKTFFRPLLVLISVEISRPFRKTFGLFLSLAQASGDKITNSADVPTRS